MTVRAYDPSLPPGVRFGAQHPLPMAPAFYEFNRARDRGDALAFVVEGPDAERGVEVIREVLNAPPDPAQSAAEFLGRPPRREVETAEITTTVGAPQGLECTGYWILNDRTKHLRERLYVVAREGRQEFRPARRWEHFPVLELHEKGTTDAPTIGAGGAEITFVCYAPPGSGVAREAAGVIAETLREIGPLLSGSPFGRARAFISADLRFRKVVPVKGPLHRGVGKDEDPPDSTPAAYRPPQRALPLRPNGPEPSKPKTYGERIEEQKREMLKDWGLLEGYDRMQAEGKARREKPAQPMIGNPTRRSGGLQSFDKAPWKETPWTR